jgi:N6-L-threonylcarbamoyladenine synthase
MASGRPVLGIETSCDETSVAILRFKEGRAELLHHEVASQLEHHRPFGGVVPEVATRQHLKVLDPMVREALERSGVAPQEFGLIAATRGPGLASSLMVGHAYARGLGMAWNVPVTGINHMEGHLLSPFLSTGQAFWSPHIALIISGGHTLLVEVSAFGDYRILGSTRDDAVGEAYDKVAKLLGLAYPGGPEVEKQAAQGDPARFHFPRSMLHSGDHEFSFSGLKTAVRYELPKLGREPGGRDIADLCAGFQAAVVEVLAGKLEKALTGRSIHTATLSGGVSCNRAIREAVEARCRENGVEFLAASPEFSTDNAAMIAYAGAMRQADGSIESGERDVDPNWKLA